jgi:GTPase SAR1 family protein
MALANLDSSALNALQSSEQQTLLDEIDNLRLQGVSEFVFLPQIVVCGDQSSGKSSVLEAISGVPFPRSDTLCTRFATEVVLRQAPVDKVEVSIVPSRDVDRSRLLAFNETSKGLDNLSELVDQAKSVMGVSVNGKAFSKDILRVEIWGPNKPKLTVVDLPGLIHSDSKQQSAADVELITELVSSYMKNPRSVILAVVSAKNDYANQIILKRARQVDPEGFRTLGLITKPDTLPKGSESEAEFVNLASNDNIHFRLGWHVVKNRDYDERNMSSEERDQSEKTFFSKGVWKDLPRDMVGVDSLRRRLSKILLEQIKIYLPSLIEDIRQNLRECKTKLQKLGDDRDTPEKQLQFLLKVSQFFQTLCKAAVDGNYDHPFFDDPTLDDEDCKRLRAVVQNRNLGFAEFMRKRGHHRDIIDDDTEYVVEDSIGGFAEDESSSSVQPVTMRRSDAVKWVRKLLVRSRGRELPGSFNPLLVGELFRDQSAPWDKFAGYHVEGIWRVSKDFLEKVFSAIVDEETSAALFTHWIDPITEKRFEDANQVLQRLFLDRKRHPITYNHYYTETLQDVRTSRQEREIELRIRRFLKVSDDRFPDYNNASISGLAKTLSTQSYKNMDDFACSELIDSMQAYYKVSHASLYLFIDH